MRSLWGVVLLCGALVPAGLAAADKGRLAAVDAYPGLSEHSRMIRKGVVDLGRRYSMHDETGRFHVIHVDEMDLECTSCHVDGGYARDYFLLQREQAEAKSKGEGKGKKVGVLDRSVCLGCHKQGGIATVWYQATDR